MAERFNEEIRLGGINWQPDEAGRKELARTFGNKIRLIVEDAQANRVEDLVATVLENAAQELRNNKGE